MYKYRITLIPTYGSDEVFLSNSWLKCKLKMLWYKITDKYAIWEEIK